MQEEASRGRNLLGTEDVADYLGVSPVTIWRWCREGSLPCFKVGRQWRIRRSALEDFLERSERSESLVGRLRSFLEVPDNVLGISQNRELMHKLDATFFMVGDAKGGMLVKYYDEELHSADKLRSDFEREGLEVSRLEQEGRLRLVDIGALEGDRTDALRNLIAEEACDGGSVWANFNWEERMDVDAALRQQEELSEFVEDSRFVVQTSILEGVIDEWPGTLLRKVQVMHSATIWLTESGTALTRVVPPPLGNEAF